MASILTDLGRSLADLARRATGLRGLGVDGHVLDERALNEIARRPQPTPWSRELARDAWPKLYPTLLSSETYVGCCAALSALVAATRGATDMARIRTSIEAIDRSLQGSPNFPAGGDRCGGAVLILTNAWGRTELGLAPGQVAESFQSELIYAAGLYARALARERDPS